MPRSSFPGIGGDGTSSCLRRIVKANSLYYGDESTRRDSMSICRRALLLIVLAHFANNVAYGQSPNGPEQPRLINLYRSLSPEEMAQIRRLQVLLKDKAQGVIAFKGLVEQAARLNSAAPDKRLLEKLDLIIAGENADVQAKRIITNPFAPR
jgi:hypothetical protein